jgi:hypothetical protein
VSELGEKKNRQLLGLGIILVAFSGFCAGVGTAMLTGLGTSPNQPRGVVFVATIGSFVSTLLFGIICLKSKKRGLG